MDQKLSGKLERKTEMPRNTTMKHILVIYEMVPEDTRIYELDVTDDELEKIQRCHGTISNLVKNSPEREADLEWLNQFVGEKKAIMTASGDCPPHSGGTYDAVILSGFHL